MMLVQKQNVRGEAEETTCTCRVHNNAIAGMYVATEVKKPITIISNVYQSHQNEICLSCILHNIKD